MAYNIKFCFQVFADRQLWVGGFVMYSSRGYKLSTLNGSIAIQTIHRLSFKYTLKASSYFLASLSAEMNLDWLIQNISVTEENRQIRVPTTAIKINNPELCRTDYRQYPSD